MSKVVAIESVTLDGVMQAPGRPDEDRRGEFTDGGWALPYADAVAGSFMAARMPGARALVLGRRTYEDFAGYWPKQTDNPYTEVLDTSTKYVASTTLSEPLPWRNSVLLEGDACDAVAELRREPGGDLVVLGQGRRLFSAEGERAALRLLDSLQTSTGVVICTYATEKERA
jgi:dihydrofolate reductase